jgi:hypothetical protein
METTRNFGRKLLTGIFGLGCVSMSPLFITAYPFIASLAWITGVSIITYIVVFWASSIRGEHYEF